MTRMIKISMVIVIILIQVFFYSWNLEAETLSVNSSKYYNYQKMNKALIYYLYIANSGGWKNIPDGVDLKKGDYGERISLLYNRLIITGDLLEDVNEENYIHKNLFLFDDTLDLAVRRFQLRHGLVADGIVGRNTLQALNVPVEKRIKQIIRNIEYMSSYSEEIGGKYIIVNIPDYKLKLIEDGKMVMEMKVIVGKKDRPTPVFNDKISYLVFNPSWIIPYRTALINIIPEIRKNSNYLREKNINVFKDWEKSVRKINPDCVNWSEINWDNFIYQLVQKPGPLNSMGLVKFIFPNKYSVYLHDTPEHTLFNERKRTFSLGCIRLERPIELAEYLLQKNPEWTSDKITEIIKSGNTEKVYLTEPIPIYLVYWTVWATDDGIINFRDDIYRKL